MITELPSLDALPRQNASQVKNKWGEVVRLVHQQGSVAVTNHSTVEMVMLDAATYRRLENAVQALKQREQAALDALNQRFDARLAQLQQAGTAQNVDSLFGAQGQLGSRPKAGDAF